MVELAVVMGVVVLPLIFGVVELGRLTFAKTMITAAAREGARYAIVHGSSSGAVTDSAGVATYVKGRTELSPIIVRPRWNNSKDAGDTVTVIVSYTYVPLVRLFPGRTITSRSRQIVAF